jgi:hypothetical protein
VRIGERAALILTYHWAARPLEEQGDVLTFDVSFTYAAGHPIAPASVQAIVDRLDFQP